MNMQVGDRIRVFTNWGDTDDFTVEEFRFCLGIFLSDNHRQAESFTTLCELYEGGSESKNMYISNFGEYFDYINRFNFGFQF